MIQEDLGEYYKRELISLPQEIDHEINLIPKEKQNPNAIYVIHHPIKIVYYMGTEKCFVYTELGMFLGTLEKYHLKRLFSKIGAILREIKNQKT